MSARRAYVLALVIPFAPLAAALVADALASRKIRRRQAAGNAS